MSRDNKSLKRKEKGKMTKYRITEETAKIYNNTTLYRIEAVKDFETIFGMIHAGDKGGFIQEEKNLEQDGNCWIFDDAKVYFGGVVKDDACIKDNATVRDGAIVEKSAKMFNNSSAINSTVTDNATLKDRAIVMIESVISDNVVIGGLTELEECTINGSCKISGDANMKGVIITA